MKVTRKHTADKIIDYLHHRITISELVNWAETAIMDAEFEEKDMDILRDVIGRLGLADVKQFGMTWENCEYFLSKLGYRIRLTVLKTA